MKLQVPVQLEMKLRYQNVLNDVAGPKPFYECEENINVF